MAGESKSNGVLNVSNKPLITKNAAHTLQKNEKREDAQEKHYKDWPNAAGVSREHPLPGHEILTIVVQCCW
jgi:hypothetical protein